MQQSQEQQLFVTLNTSLAQVALSNCDCCRRSHMKCDRLLPCCTGCKARQRECVYSNKRTNPRKSKPEQQEIGSSKKKRKLSTSEIEIAKKEEMKDQQQIDIEAEFLDTVSKNVKEFFTAPFYEWCGFDTNFPILLPDRLEVIVSTQIEFIKEMDYCKEFDPKQTLFAQFQEHQQQLRLNYNFEPEIDLEDLKSNADTRISSLLPSVLYLCQQHLRQEFATSLYNTIETKQIHLCELALLFSMESALCFHLGLNDISKKLFDKVIPILNFLWSKIVSELSMNTLYNFQILTGVILFVSQPLIDLQNSQYLPQFSQCCDLYFTRYQEFSENSVFKMPQDLQRIHSALSMLSTFFGTRVFINFLFSSSSHEELMSTYSKIINTVVTLLDKTDEIDIKTKLKVEILDNRLAIVNHQLEVTSFFLDFFRAVRLILQQDSYTSKEAVEKCLAKINDYFTIYLTCLKDRVSKMVANPKLFTTSYTLMFKGLELQLLIAFREEFLRQEFEDCENSNQIYERITGKIYEVSDYLSNSIDEPTYLFCFHASFYSICVAAQIHIERYTIHKSTAKNIKQEKEFLNKDLRSLELNMLRRLDRIPALRFLYSKLTSCLHED